MTRAIAVVVVSAAVGCAPTLVPLRFDLPVSAGVSFTDVGVDARTPFVARVEAGSLWPWAGVPITVELDADAAARLGGAHAMRLYGRINVAQSMWPPGNQPIELAPSFEDLRALVRGEVDEITDFAVAGPPCGACAAGACPHHGPHGDMHGMHGDMHGMHGDKGGGHGERGMRAWRHWLAVVTLRTRPY